MEALRQRRRQRDMTTRRWADLPKDLLSLIAEKLQTHIDILRWRSVCASWRSSIPPIRRSPVFPVNLPILPDEIRIFTGHFILSESTIYRLDPPASNSSPENSGSWLLRVEETSVGLTRFEKPLSKRLDRQPPYGFPKVLNLLDFRVSELCRVYNVSSNSNSSLSGMGSVALSSRPCSSNDDYVLLAVRRYDGTNPGLPIWSRTFSPRKNLLQHPLAQLTQPKIRSTFQKDILQVLQS